MKAIWLGRCGYDEAHAIQLAARDAVIAGGGVATLLLLEHEPVVTFGRRGPLDDLRVSRDEIERRGIAIRASERGGQTTYHGPGQLVGYLIATLRDIAPSVPAYVWSLEEALIQTAAAVGVAAERCHCGHGVWIGDEKIGSVGIAVSRGVTWHGFALNVDPDLSAFDLIKPCGLEIEMTSLTRHGVTADVRSIAETARRQLATVFGGDIEPIVDEPG